MIQYQSFENQKTPGGQQMSKIVNLNKKTEIIKTKINVSTQQVFTFVSN